MIKLIFNLPKVQISEVISVRSTYCTQEIYLNRSHFKEFINELNNIISLRVKFGLSICNFTSFIKYWQEECSQDTYFIYRKWKNTPLSANQADLCQAESHDLFSSNLLSWDCCS